MRSPVRSWERTLFAVCSPVVGVSNACHGMRHAPPFELTQWPWPDAVWLCVHCMYPTGVGHLLKQYCCWALANALQHSYHAALGGKGMASAGPTYTRLAWGRCDMPRRHSHSAAKRKAEGAKPFLCGVRSPDPIAPVQTTQAAVYTAYTASKPTPSAERHAAHMWTCGRPHWANLTSCSTCPSSWCNCKCKCMIIMILQRLMLAMAS